jgi:radical SAM superfamily enzyme YgiQ (UPF0313 family)
VLENILSSNLPVPDLGTAYIVASLKKAGHRCDILDAAVGDNNSIHELPGKKLYILGMELENIIAKIPVDVDYVGISCMFTNCWINDLRIIKAIKLKFPSLKIILGGEHTTATSSYILSNHPEVDYCVIGEGEETITELISNLENNLSLYSVAGIALRDKNGKTMITSSRKRLNPSSLPRPYWDESTLEFYFHHRRGINSNEKKTMVMLATRGCPYTCTFCTNDFMWSPKWIPRVAEDVVDEIKYYVEKYSVEHIDFLDLTILIQKDWMNAFCDLLIEANLKITWAIPVGTRTENLDKDLLVKMKKSGLIRVLYAPESASDETLVMIQKKLSINKFTEVVKESIRAGIDVKINFIIGFPDQNIRQLYKSYIFLWKMMTLGVHDLITLAFVPYPGTQLYKELNIQYPYSDQSFRIPLNNNIFHPRSWNKDISDFNLRLLMIFFNLSFYLGQFILRPKRLFIFFYRVFIIKRPRTNFESILHHFIRNRFSIRKLNHD